MDDDQLLRYSRHILLDDFGIEAQQRFLTTTALVVGAGGLGAAALPYLAASGIGRIIIADHDHVDLTNLQRQIIHREASIGQNKAQSAKTALQAINSTIQFEIVTTRLDDASLPALVVRADIVLDCTDNFTTRHAINRACVALKKMLVSGAAIRMDGQVTSFDFRVAAQPCYACLFPEDANVEEERCAVMGVMAPLVGVIGTMQAVEALRMLAGLSPSDGHGRLQLFDARQFNWREVRYRRDTNCRVCGDGVRSDGVHKQTSLSEVLHV